MTVILEVKTKPPVGDQGDDKQDSLSKPSSPSYEP